MTNKLSPEELKSIISALRQLNPDAIRLYDGDTVTEFPGREDDIQ